MKIHDVIHGTYAACLSKTWPQYRKRLWPWIAVTIISLSSPAMAEDELCPPSLLSPDYELLHEFRQQVPPGYSKTIYISSNRIQWEATGSSILDGEVFMHWGSNDLLASRILYDADMQAIHVPSQLLYEGSSFRIKADSGNFFIIDESGTLHDLSYQLNGMPGRGQADVIHFERSSPSTMEKISYTTCPIGQEDWMFRAAHARFNHDREVATVKHARLHFMGAPIFYLPYLRFPTGEQRQTGFLMPSIGSSNESGLTIKAPFYWNIAPNHDATITPYYVEKRGAAIDTEYRYLTQYNRGQMEGLWLPDDERRNEDRSLISWQDQSQWNRVLSTWLNYSEVSDDQYFDDIGDGFDNSTIPYLDQNVGLLFGNHAWSLQMQAQRFQELELTRDSYERMPSIMASSQVPWRWGPLLLDWRGEIVRFSKDDLFQGNRIDSEVGLGMEWEQPGYFLRPRFGYRYTAYDLNNRWFDENGRDSDDDLSRGLPITSIDSGLRFVRDLNWQGTHWAQTLEPRMFFLLVPYEDQDNLPLFDTAHPNMEFYQLYSDNRFSGADRIGDAKQLSTALTTRFWKQNEGQERLSMSIGQIRYFDEQDVLLPSETPEKHDSSDIISSITVNPNQWVGGHLRLHWDADDARSQQTIADINFTGPRRQALNVSYRLRRDLVQPLEQVDLSLVLPVSKRWQFAARWNYSLREEESLDQFAGIEYSSCCWIGRAMIRRFVDFDEDNGWGKQENAFYLELELKGLSSLGDLVRDRLGGGIAGYQPMP